MTTASRGHNRRRGAGECREFHPGGLGTLSRISLALNVLRIVGETFDLGPIVDRSFRNN